MCMSSPKPPPPVELPEPVKPIEAAPVNAPPPPPAATATYLGKKESTKVSSNPTASRGFSSLRIRPRTGSTTGLNVPN